MTAPDGRRVRMNGVRDLEVSTLDTRDREIIDQAADALNAEMEDVLSYQADL